jgi:serine/threonine protein kinase
MPNADTRPDSRTEGEARQALRRLLCASFEPDEFVVFTRECASLYISADVRLCDELPAHVRMSRTIYFAEVIELLQRHGLLREEFFLDLLRLRPFRAEAIGAAAALHGFDIDVQCSAALRGNEAPIVDVPVANREEARRVATVEQLALLVGESTETGARALALCERPDRSMRSLNTEICESLILRKGAVVAGTVLESFHDSGAFGQIWLAHPLDAPDKIVATKILHLHHLTKGRFLRHFRRGCRAMQALEAAQTDRVQGSIVRLLSVASDTLAFSMEYYPNGNLVDIQRLRWDLPTKLAKWRLICEAIAFAHRVGIIHRDIRPANIVLDKYDNPILTDFDIADIASLADTSVTWALGSEAFASPEQRSGERKRGAPADDIYSLGRLLHFMLIEREPPPVTRDPNLLRDCPAGLASIIRRCLALDARQRYTDVDQLLQALDAYADAQRVAVAPVARTRSRLVSLGTPTMAMSCIALYMWSALADGVLAGRLTLPDDPPQPMPSSLAIPDGPPPVAISPHPEDSPINIDEAPAPEDAPPIPPSRPRWTKKRPEPPANARVDAPMDLTSVRSVIDQASPAFAACRDRHDPALSNASVRLVARSARRKGDGTPVSVLIPHEDKRSHFRAQTFHCISTVLQRYRFAPLGAATREYNLHIGDCSVGSSCGWFLKEAT